MKRATRIKLLAGLAVIAVAAILLLLALELLETASSQDQDMPDWLLRKLDRYQLQIDSIDPAIDPGKREYVEARRDRLLADWRAGRIASPAPTDANATPMPPPPGVDDTTRRPSNLPARAAGAGTIIENGQAPFPAMEYLFENQWVEELPGEGTVQVFAGVQGSAIDPSRSQGVVVVLVRGADWNPVYGGGAYPTPLKAGSVRVTDATGEVLTLTAGNGTVFQFDVASRTYLGWPAPIATPWPTLEATPAPSPSPRPTDSTGHAAAASPTP